MSFGSIVPCHILIELSLCNCFYMVNSFTYLYFMFFCCDWDVLKSSLKSSNYSTLPTTAYFCSINKNQMYLCCVVSLGVKEFLWLLWKMRSSRLNDRKWPVQAPGNTVRTQKYFFLDIVVVNTFQSWKQGLQFGKRSRVSACLVWGYSFILSHL